MTASSNAYSIADLRDAARRRLPRAIFDFFDGGAEDEITLADNLAAFHRVRLMPRTLVDVSKVDISATVLGGPSALPLAIAPTGAVGFGRHGGDIAIARAAVAAGIPYTLSSTATASIEQIADAAPGRLWFQAYILRNKPFLHGWIDRAEAAGYEALVITVDLPVGGKRERDARNDFRVPFRFTPHNMLDFATRPRWVLDLLRHGMPVMENLRGIESDTTSASELASSVGRNYDPAFDWDALAALRDHWPRKLIVKGIVHPGDAARAARLGADAIVVSNHGGRQLDGAPATLDALPGVAATVRAASQARVSVLLDGGVRRGVDILKARALGADAVLVGRATLYGVAAGGETGARRALSILQDEFVRSMQLCGVTRNDAITPALVFRREGSTPHMPAVIAQEPVAPLL